MECYLPVSLDHVEGAEERPIVIFIVMPASVLGEERVSDVGANEARGEAPSESNI